MSDEPSEGTLARFLEAFGLGNLQPYQQDMVDFLTSGEPLVIGIDYSRDRDKTIVTQIVGTSPAYVMFDEVDPDLASIIGIYGKSSKPIGEHQGQMVINLSKSLAALRDDFLATDLECLPFDPSMVNKGGKLIKRHHPIPKTPRSPRQSKRRR